MESEFVQKEEGISQRVQIRRDVERKKQRKNKSGTSTKKSVRVKPQVEPDSCLLINNELKFTLTHPQVLTSFMEWADLNEFADSFTFYTMAANIRQYDQNGDKFEAQDLFEVVVRKYILPDAPCRIELLPRYRSIILQHAGEDGSVQPFLFPFAVEGMRLAQTEVFLKIRNVYWSRFATSEIYENLCKHKTIRVLVGLPELSKALTTTLKITADANSPNTNVAPTTP